MASEIGLAIWLFYKLNNFKFYSNSLSDSIGAQLSTVKLIWYSVKFKKRGQVSIESITWVVFDKKVLLVNLKKVNKYFIKKL